MQRPWASLRAQAALLALKPDRNERMAEFIRLAWPVGQATGVSWIGFYVAHAGAAPGEELVLAAREPKPACSPISLKGACGRSFLSREPFVVEKVRDLGANYIACDPRDQSEVVVPCLEPDGTAWGVLDLDSHEIGFFSSEDAHQLVYLLKLAGLSA